MLQHSHKERVPFTLHQWFMLSCIFSFILLCARIAETGSPRYIFLLWNLFLAFVPYTISYWLCNNQPVRNKLKLIAAISAWLLFIPNAFYILTDLFHLDEISAAPKWFDLLLLLSFAWNGLFFGVASLRQMEITVQKISGKGSSLLIVFIVMWLNAFGIYIGRFLRYNSWDIITQPFSLFSEMLEILLHPFKNRMEWGMISCYAVFMSLLYITIIKMSENFNQLNSHQIKINK